MKGRGELLFTRIYKEDYGRRYLAEASEYEERVVDCARDICEYVIRNHPHFPAHTDAMLQAHHVEREYYERFFVNGLTETHRRHPELWD